MVNWIDIPEQEVADAYKKGATLRQLAKLYGVSIPKVQQTLVRLGVPRRKQGTIGANLSRDEQIRAEYRIAGKSMRQLAKEYGITYQRVYQIVNFYVKPEQRYPDEQDIFG